MQAMPKWLIALVVVGWVGAGIAFAYGYWIPVVVLGGLGILAATSAGGLLLAQRSALRAAQHTLSAKPIAAKDGESPDAAAARRRDEAKRRHERNKRRRRKG